MAIPNKYEDVSDIMSKIMESNQASSNMRRRFSNPTSPITSIKDNIPSRPVLVTDSNNIEISPNSYKNNHTWYYIFITVAVLLIFAAVGYFSRTYISALLTPPSPFTEKIAQQSFALFYPTKLPGTFKIELDSVAALNNNVITYSLSDDAGQKVSFKLQLAPKGLNLAAFEELYTSFEFVSTEATTVKVGVTDQNTNIAHMLAGNTWITATSPKDALSLADYDILLNNLELDD
ncbi:MAG: hypothetical protein M3Q36_01560 [bacterium]|nr:hypothetical protein [bacterium]